MQAEWGAGLVGGPRPGQVQVRLGRTGWGGRQAEMMGPPSKGQDAWAPMEGQGSMWSGEGSLGRAFLGVRQWAATQTCQDTEHRGRGTGCWRQNPQLLGRWGGH